MAVPRLAGLPRGDEHNGFIPVFGVADKAHSGAVSLHGRAHAVLRSRLRLVRDAEESLQQTVVPNRMEHVERVETLPRPVFNALALALFG